MTYIVEYLNKGRLEKRFMNSDNTHNLIKELLRNNFEILSITREDIYYLIDTSYQLEEEY